MASVCACRVGDSAPVPCSQAATQTELPACCGHIIVSLLRDLAVAQSKLTQGDRLWPEALLASLSAACATVSGQEAVEDSELSTDGPGTEPSEDETMQQEEEDAESDTEDPLKLPPDGQWNIPAAEPEDNCGAERFSIHTEQGIQLLARPTTTSSKENSQQHSSSSAAPEAVVTAGDIQVECIKDEFLDITDFKLTETLLDAHSQSAAMPPSSKTQQHTLSAQLQSDDQSTHHLQEQQPSQSNWSGIEPSTNRPMRSRHQSRPPPPLRGPYNSRPSGCRQNSTEAAVHPNSGGVSNVVAVVPTARPQLESHHDLPASCGHTASLELQAGGHSHHCGQCGMAFPCQSDLQAHQLTHTRQRPHECTECKWQFSGLKSLQQHKRTMHAGKEAHCCPHCGRAFGRLHILQNHILTHTGEDPYSCRYCECSFSLKRNLIAHIRKYHGENH